MEFQSVAIANAQLPGYAGLYWLRVERGAIAELMPMDALEQPLPSDDEVLDVEGDWISLGGVDLQINGALGLAFPEVRSQDQEKLTEIAQYLWQQGVDAFLPTLVTTSLENIGRSRSVLAQFTPTTTKPAAKLLGIHLEGPFLNPEKRGAHPAEHLRPLTLEQVKQVMGDRPDFITVLTLAPELDSTQQIIPYLKSLGITVSLGHSQATAAQAKTAFQQGASMVTHAFNAMPGLHHREPGLLGAALTTPGVHCGFIADGHHVSPLMLELLIRLCRSKDPQRAIAQDLFLVSDALAPLGLPDGMYPWDDRQIQVTAGTARLLDGTLSGTTLPLLVGVQNLVQWGICPPGEAIALATEAPRKAIGLPGMGIGQPAHLLRWHYDPSTCQLNWQRLSL